MFSIYRDQNALHSLNETWEGADEVLRASIVQASRRVDQQLQVSPLDQGESRDERTRVLFQAPLAVTYEVDEAKKMVCILKAWAFRSGPKRRAN